MTEQEYRDKFYCDCPRCGNQPGRFVEDAGVQYALCDDASHAPSKWSIGFGVLDNCPQEPHKALTRYQQVVA